MSTDIEKRCEWPEADRSFSATDSCRLVVSYFRERSEDVATLDELVAYGTEQTDESRTSDQLAIRLHHSTLPKLADVGALDYDERTHTVRYWGYPLSN